MENTTTEHELRIYKTEFHQTSKQKVNAKTPPKKLTMSKKIRKETFSDLLRISLEEPDSSLMMRVLSLTIIRTQNVNASNRKSPQLREKEIKERKGKEKGGKVNSLSKLKSK